MKLFLSSMLKHPDTLNELDKFCGGLKGRAVAYIPTAANAEEGFNAWKNGGTWELAKKLGIKVDIVQFEDFRDDTYVDLIRNKDMIWLMGGFPGYLMYWIKLRSFDKYIKEFINQGKIIVGSSAGAMVMGKSLDIGEWGFDEYAAGNERGSSQIKPLGLVDFDIFPHFKDEYFDNIKQKYTGRKIYLLKDGEEIIVEDQKITVIGKERLITND